jgi:hypothetical protein
MTDTLRTTLRLNEIEAACAAKLRDPSTPEAAAIRDLTGKDDLSGAPVVTIAHALIEAGIKAVNDRAEEVGYNRLREFLKTDDEHKAWRASRRRRANLRRAQGIEGEL